MRILHVLINHFIKEPFSTFLPLEDWIPPNLFKRIKSHLPRLSSGGFSATKNEIIILHPSGKQIRIRPDSEQCPTGYISVFVRI